MPNIILDGQVVADNWLRLDPDQAADLDQWKDRALMLPLACWNEQHESLGKRPHTGIWLASTELPQDIAGAWTELPLVAIDFPVFSDGRGFSLARLIRQRYGYQGQLRAVGSPIRDQLAYLLRCGFNAVQLAEHYDPLEALASLKVFSDSYQTAVDQTMPLFRRRQT